MNEKNEAFLFEIYGKILLNEILSKLGNSKTGMSKSLV